MKNLINISHILICLALQGIGYALIKNPFIGAVAGVFFFAGREIAQAEYRRIESSESKLRKDMPLLGGLDPRFWTAKAFFADLTIPAIIVSLVGIILHLTNS